MYLNMRKTWRSHLQKRPRRSGDWTSERETRLREIAGDGAESRNPQIRRSPTPRRRPRGGRLLRIRHRRQVCRLQGRCCRARDWNFE
uniref:Uncharacterized protein n=1 Tax=Arundo donax TaxID=35708 RepID=A0A0A9GXW4_ARUDO